MSRIPLPYNPKVMDLFRNPKNLGKMEDATVVAVAGNPACGDMITFYLKSTNKHKLLRRHNSKVTVVQPTSPPPVLSLK